MIAGPAREPVGTIRWLLEWFVVLSAWLVASGWILSAVGRLNRWGYILVFVAFGAAAFAAIRSGLLRSAPDPWRPRFRWPRQGVVRLFVCLLLATLVGAVSQRISHFDTLSYRLPRVLQYLGENRWHWIRTSEFRMNAVAPGIEWIWTPIFAFKAPEHLVNALGSLYYLFLPGLVFGVWVQSGVSPRTAWWWCWILPAGYCYAMQAGGPAVDLPGTIYTLAAVDFALRAWRRRSWRHLCLSILAVSLMGTLRLMCLPLALVWVVPAMGSLFRHRRPPGWVLAGTTALALVCSFIPGGYFNVRFAGSFRGIPTEAYPAIQHPLLVIIPNLVWYVFQNLVPPFFPWHQEWNHWANRVTAAMGDRFAGLPFWGTVERGASEQNAGLGFTVFVFVLVSIGLAWRYRSPTARARSPMNLWLWGTAWFALVVFASQIGLAQSGRYLASYYPLLLAPFLACSGFEALVRRRSWQRWATLVVALSLGLIVVSRQRPVWPVFPLVKALAHRMPGNRLVHKVEESFDRAALRPVMRDFIAHNLPATEITVGYYALSGTAELDLSGEDYARRVWRMDGSENADWFRSRNIRHVLFEEWNPITPDHPTSSRQWLDKMGGGRELDRLSLPYGSGEHADIVLLDLGPKP